MSDRENPSTSAPGNGNEGDAPQQPIRGGWFTPPSALDVDRLANQEAPQTPEVQFPTDAEPAREAVGTSRRTRPRA